jgi:hypothetical protein
MKAKVHSFEFREGAGYTMSLFYPETGSGMTGKTSAKEDRFTSRFVELVPDKKIIEAIRFESTDPSFSQEMIMEVWLEAVTGGTNVCFLFKNLPKAIKPEDNEAGTVSSLEKLARYVE